MKRLIIRSFPFLTFFLFSFGWFWMVVLIDILLIFVFARSGCFPWSVYILPSEVWPENIIQDRFNKDLDKLKRSVLGLFCHFIAKNRIFLEISGKRMVKSRPIGTKLKPSWLIGTKARLCSTWWGSILKDGTFINQPRVFTSLYCTFAIFILQKKTEQVRNQSNPALCKSTSRKLWTANYEWYTSDSVIYQ